MKNIVFKKENFARIQTVLNEVQKRSRTREIDLTNIESGLERAQIELDKILYRKDQVGIILCIDMSAQIFPAAYYGVPESTQFCAKKTAAGFTITAIFRGTTGTREITIDEAEFKIRGEQIISFIAKKFY